MKNSLGKDDLPSVSYVIEGTEVETPEGVMETGRFVAQELTDRTVADVLRELNSDSDLGQARDAKRFITDYLAGCPEGKAEAKDVMAEGREHGFARRTLQRARHNVADMKRVGAQPHQTTFWILHEPSSDATDASPTNPASVASDPSSGSNPRPTR